MTIELSNEDIEHLMWCEARGYFPLGVLTRLTLESWEREKVGRAEVRSWRLGWEGVTCLASAMDMDAGDYMGSTAEPLANKMRKYAETAASMMAVVFAVRIFRCLSVSS